MLGIKIVSVNGNETVFEANRVELAPYGLAHTNLEKGLFIFRDGEIVEIDSGDVYVMNSNGKTIADYHFGTPPIVEELKPYTR